MSIRRGKRFIPGAEAFEPRLLLAGPTSAFVARPGRSLVQALRSDGRFTILADALSSTELGRTLARQGRYLMIAPTDKAFDALPESIRAPLLDPANGETLVRFLSHSIAKVGRPGRDPWVATLSGRTMRLSEWMPASRQGVAPIRAGQGTIFPVDRAAIPFEEFDFLFSQVADSGSLEPAGDGAILRLQGVRPTLAFTDRPFRLSFDVESDVMAELWRLDDAHAFRADPPNAALTYTGPDGRRGQLKPELLDAWTTEDGMAYFVRGAGTSPASLESPSLFIDSLWPGVGTGAFDRNLISIIQRAVESILRTQKTIAEASDRSPLPGG